ncbi:hypothetical protein KW782_03700 [Candidatus Parcubacteria bacterium]|nr:hypothetical protein [Candidatus Parcubacteria bacterium]
MFILNPLWAVAAWVCNLFGWNIAKQVAPQPIDETKTERRMPMARSAIKDTASVKKFQKKKFRKEKTPKPGILSCWMKKSGGKEVVTYATRKGNSLTAIVIRKMSDGRQTYCFLRRPRHPNSAAFVRRQVA